MAILVINTGAIRRGGGGVNRVASNPSIFKLNSQIIEKWQP